MTKTTKTTKTITRTVRVEKLRNHSKLVTMTIDAKTDAYLLYDAPSDEGRAFVLVNLSNAEKYSVLVNPKLCDCKGHTRYGYCKHADALTALVNAGRL